MLAERQNLQQQGKKFVAAKSTSCLHHNSTNPVCQRMHVQQASSCDYSKHSIALHPCTDVAAMLFAKQKQDLFLHLSASLAGRSVT